MTTDTLITDLEALWDLDDDQGEIHIEDAPGRSYCGLALHDDFRVSDDVPVTCMVCAEIAPLVIVLRAA